METFECIPIPVCGNTCKLGQNSAKFSKIQENGQKTNKIFAAKPLLKTDKFSQFGRK